MKRVLCIFIIATLLLAILLSCYKISQSDNWITPSPSIAISVPSITLSAPPADAMQSTAPPEGSDTSLDEPWDPAVLPPIVMPDDAPYEFSIATYSTQPISLEDMVNVQYPQISALGDVIREQEINEMIKNHIVDTLTINEMSHFNPLATDAVYDLDVIFQITLYTEELLSVVYVGNAKYYSEGRPAYRIKFIACSITIDLINVKKLSLADCAYMIPPEVELRDSDIIDRIHHATEVYEFGYSCNESYAVNTFITIHEDFIRQPSFNFFVTPDAVYYINMFPFAGGGYLFLKVPDDDGSYEPMIVYG